MNLVYLFSWPLLGKAYYGVRYGREATVESIGTTYFSSSEYVKKFIAENGPPPLVEVRRIFDTPREAKKWEDTVLRRLGAISSRVWLNRANNNAFKGTVMDADTRASISKSKQGKPLGRFYTDGVRNIRSLDGVVPQGFAVGFSPSAAQLAHYKNLNANLDAAKRSVIGKKAGDKTRGVPKPPGHGSRVSAALTGKKRPWQAGDNNPARRPEVRALISARKKGQNGSQQSV